MRFWIQTLVTTVLFITGMLQASPNAIQHSHAKILGTLLYSDLSVSWDDQPIVDVLQQLEDDLHIDMFVFWESDSKDGIDKSTPITLKLPATPAIVVLERIIGILNINNEPNTWQLRDGMLEVGLKDQFTQGRSMELRTYDVMSLLFTIRDFDNAPEMGTTGGGGNGGGGGVQFGNPTEEPESQTKEQEVQELIDTITDFVESEQWKVHGGNCTIRFYKGSLLVKAPDFVHRQLGGYEYAPIRPRHVKPRTMNFSGGSTTVRLPRVPNI